MLHPVLFRPDPLRDPGSLHESNRWWLALFFTFSTLVHTSLWLALPATERLPPAPGFLATEVFEIDPPPPVPVPPDPPPAPAKSPETLPPAQPSPNPQPRPIPQAQPALAAAVFTAHDNAGPLDFTNEFVTGQATSFSGGATSSRGAISQVRANGTETLRPSAPSNAPSRDQSRRASVVGGFAWSCPFPPAADHAAINFAVVQLRLRVDAQGRLEQLGVVADPGHGFAEAARRCASGKRFLPALDRDGAPVSSELAVRVRFTR